MATQTMNQTHSNPKLKNGALWVLQIALGLVFLNAGFKKLTGDPSMIGLFEAVGIGQWFRYVTGLIEMIAGVLVLSKKLSGIGGLLICCTMFGALMTHLLIVGGSITLPLTLFLLALIVAYGRRHQYLDLMRETNRNWTP